MTVNGIKNGGWKVLFSALTLFFWMVLVLPAAGCQSSDGVALRCEAQLAVGISGI